MPASSQETGIGIKLSNLPLIYPSWCKRPTFQIGFTRSSKEKLQNLDKVFGVQCIKVLSKLLNLPVMSAIIWNTCVLSIAA